MATMQVKNAAGGTETIEKPLTPGRAAAAASRPVVLSDEDKAAVDAIATSAKQDEQSTLLDTIITGIAAVVSAIQGTLTVTVTATIANGESLSDAVDLATSRLAKINMPASWTAASLTFQTSADDVTYRNLYDAYGTEITYTVAADRSVIVDPKDWIGTRYVKVRSGTSASPVNQGGDRELELVAFQ